jgi:putative redox protein
MREVRVHTVPGTAIAVDATIGPHTIRFDEPVDTPGGTDTGPAPTRMLLASLGACEAITLKMYAARKGWPLQDVHVTLNGSMVDGVFVIRRHLVVDGQLDESQRARLHDIVNRCPVQRILTGEVRIEDVATG